MQVCRVAGYLVTKAIDSYRVSLELVLGDDEAGQTVKLIFAQEICRPLTPDHRTLVWMEL